VSVSHSSRIRSSPRAEFEFALTMSADDPSASAKDGRDHAAATPDAQASSTMSASAVSPNTNDTSVPQPLPLRKAIIYVNNVTSNRSHSGLFPSSQLLHPALWPLVDVDGCDPFAAPMRVIRGKRWIIHSRTLSIRGWQSRVLDDTSGPIHQLRKTVNAPSAMCRARTKQADCKQHSHPTYPTLFLSTDTNQFRGVVQ